MKNTLQVLKLLINKLHPIKDLSVLLLLKNVNTLSKYLVSQKLSQLENACAIIKKYYYQPDRYAAYKCKRILDDFNYPIYKNCYVVRHNNEWLILKGFHSYSAYCYTGLLSKKIPITFQKRVSRQDIKNLYLKQYRIYSTKTFPFQIVKEDNFMLN